MFLAIFLLSRVPQGRALPLSIHPREEDRTTTRTTYDIVWSCFVTILACVWTAGHPNIPAPRDAGWTRLKRRIVIMIYALIAPEMMVFWAWRQSEAAEQIAIDYNKEFIFSSTADESAEQSMWQKAGRWLLQSVQNIVKGAREWCTILPETAAQRNQDLSWSQSHGFLIQMGGFMLYEGGTAKQILDYDVFKLLLKAGAIEAPIITDCDIRDRSKGNAISKCFVVLQTTWFVLQCIARAQKHLPLCELEIVTLGFAVLNLVVYAVWWNKPQGVEVSFYIPLKDATALANMIQNLSDLMLEGAHHELEAPPVAEAAVQRNDTGHRESVPVLNQDRTSSETFATTGPTVLQDSSSLFNNHPTLQSSGSPSTSQSTSSQPVRQDLIDKLKSLLPQVAGQASCTKNEDSVAPSHWLRRQIFKDRQRMNVGLSIFFFIYRCVQSVLRPLAKMADSRRIPIGALRVPMFYAYSNWHISSDAGSPYIASEPIRPNVNVRANGFGVIRDAFVFYMRVLGFGAGNSLTVEAGRGYLVSCCVGVIFGSVHILGWSGTFVTSRERTLWRVSAVVVTVVPFFVSQFQRWFHYGGIFHKQNLLVPKGADLSLFWTSRTTPVFVILVYVFARFTLLTLALIALRGLTPGMHTAVSWVTFIPHI